MPETTMPPGAAFVIAIMLLCAAGFVLVLVYKVLLWRDARRVERPRARRVKRRRVMSRPALARPRAQAANPPVFAAKLNGETAETPQRVAEIDEAIFHSGENAAIARLIAEGTIKLTEGVKIGTGKRSGDAYSKRSKEIQALVKEMQDKYPQRTPEQSQLRGELGIGKP